MLSQSGAREAETRDQKGHSTVEGASGLRGGQTGAAGNQDGPQGPGKGETFGFHSRCDGKALKLLSRKPCGLVYTENITLAIAHRSAYNVKSPLGEA